MDVMIGVFSLAEIPAEDLLWDQRPWHSRPHYRGPLIGPTELAHLAVTLGTGGFAATIAGFSLLAGESQDVPWVISIPADLIEAVAALDDSDIVATARMWAQRDDLSGRFSVEDLEHYLAGAGAFLRDTPGPHALRVVARRPRLEDRSDRPREQG